eukprot:14744331-Ditylum_brightwellii.AAC.1
MQLVSRNCAAQKSMVETLHTTMTTLNAPAMPSTSQNTEDLIKYTITAEMETFLLGIISSTIYELTQNNLTDHIIITNNSNAVNIITGKASSPTGDKLMDHPKETQDDNTTDIESMMQGSPKEHSHDKTSSDRRQHCSERHINTH